MLNRQAFIIARREFLERVRSRWFVLVTLLGPLALMALLVVPVWLTLRSAEAEHRIQVVDLSGASIGEHMNLEVDAKGINFEVENISPDTPRDVLDARIRDEEIDGYVTLPKDVLAGGTVVYRGDNTANALVERGLVKLVEFAIFRARGKNLGLDDGAIASLFLKNDFDVQQTTGTGEASSGRASFGVGYAVMLILYMSIILYAVSVLRSVIVEKNNRVVEVMVSSVKPLSLMVGKIVGVGCVGLVQLLAWGVFAILLATFREEVLGFFGFPGAGQINLPALGVGELVVVLVYFLLGFFFYAALYAAIGATVNSEQEAQQAQTPVMLLLMVPILCMQIVAGDPRGGVSQVLTQIPFSSPILMPMRYLMDAVSPIEMAISIALLVASLIGVVFLGAKIYRVGILSYGKKPTLKELWRWLQ